jgi:hypothetical protein
MHAISRSEVWPANDAKEIAMATRIVMLSAAARTCPIGGHNRDQDKLLNLLSMSTDVGHVEGQSFPEFVADAQQRLSDGARKLIPDRDAVSRSLADIEACEPADIIGKTYERVVDLASEVYRSVLHETLDPALEREVVLTGSARSKLHVSGGAFSRRNVVSLHLYASGFDLVALALVPYILTHELICHVGARHIGSWEEHLIPISGTSSPMVSWIEPPGC